MTARETLTMFARLKNLPERAIPRVVRSLLEKVTLTPYADRVCGSYSGGNKRKLSLAIALVGSPAVVFLDEPSSGMDPLSAARGSDHRGAQPAVHRAHDDSMEEAEALCCASRSWRRAGCSASGSAAPQVQVRRRLRVRAAMRAAARRCARRRRPSVRGRARDRAPRGKLKFELPSEKDGGGSLAGVFETLEAQKEELGVEDIKSQPTIEDIFLKIAGEKDPRRRREGRRRGAAPAPAPEAEAVEMMRPSGEMKVVVATPMPDDPLTVELDVLM